jgi:membrane protein DedA with SNARE-associated domain
MIFAGEIVLLSAIFLAVTGRLHLFYAAGLSLVTTLSSDLFWDWLGRRFPASVLLQRWSQ